MAVQRIGSATPAAGVTQTLATATFTSVASVIAANKSSASATVTIFIVPLDAGESETARVYLCANLVIAAGQSFETFRFALQTGDQVRAVSDSPDISYSVTAVYETEGTSNITYSTLQPGYPTVGDIWINSTDGATYFYTPTGFQSLAYVGAGPAGAQGPTGPLGNTGQDQLVVEQQLEEALLHQNFLFLTTHLVLLAMLG